MRLQQGPNEGKEWTGSAAVKLAKWNEKWSRRVEGVDGSKVGGNQRQALTGLKGVPALSTADRTKDWPDISLASSLLASSLASSGKLWYALAALDAPKHKGFANAQAPDGMIESSPCRSADQAHKWTALANKTSTSFLEAVSPFYSVVQLAKKAVDRRTCIGASAALPFRAFCGVILFSETRGSLTTNARLQRPTTPKSFITTRTCGQPRPLNRHHDNTTTYHSSHSSRKPSLPTMSVAFSAPWMMSPESPGPWPARQQHY